MLDATSFRMASRCILWKIQGHKMEYFDNVDSFNSACGKFNLGTTASL